MISTELPPALTTRLFDRSGRRIVRNLASAAHGAVRGRFICNQPAIDYAAIHDRISRYLDCPGAISAAAFEDRAEAILRRLRADQSCADITNAVSVPFFLPQTPHALGRDQGVYLEHIYLPAIDRSFRDALPGRDFVNHHKAALAGKLRVAPGSRHEQLLREMQDRVAVGYLFVSLTEFSIPAAAEQLQQLPAQFLLAGGADLSAAILGSPDLLLRADGYPPLIWLAGLDAEVETAGYHFEAYGYDLTFNRRTHFNQAAEYWACALTVLG
jgi:hypothetical protein